MRGPGRAPNKFKAECARRRKPSVRGATNRQNPLPAWNEERNSFGPPAAPHPRGRIPRRNCAGALPDWSTSGRLTVGDTEQTQHPAHAVKSSYLRWGKISRVSSGSKHSLNPLRPKRVPEQLLSERTSQSHPPPPHCSDQRTNFLASNLLGVDIKDVV